MVEDLFRDETEDSEVAETPSYRELISDIIVLIKDVIILAIRNYPVCSRNISVSALR